MKITISEGEFAALREIDDSKRGNSGITIFYLKLKYLYLNKIAIECKDLDKNYITFMPSQLDAISEKCKKTWRNYLSNLEKNELIKVSCGFMIKIEFLE